VVENVDQPREVPLFTWSIVKGLAGSRVGAACPNTRELIDAVCHIVRNPRSGLYVFLDARPWLDHAACARMIREIAFEHANTRMTLVFVGLARRAASDLQRMSATSASRPSGPRK
jgi:hypothetical protein